MKTLRLISDFLAVYVPSNTVFLVVELSTTNSTAFVRLFSSVALAVLIVIFEKLIEPARSTSAFLSVSTYLSSENVEALNVSILITSPAFASSSILALNWIFHDFSNSTFLNVNVFWSLDTLAS